MSFVSVRVPATLPFFWVAAPDRPVGLSKSSASLVL